MVTWIKTSFHSTVIYKVVIIYIPDTLMIILLLETKYHPSETINKKHIFYTKQQIFLFFMRS